MQAQEQFRAKYQQLAEKAELDERRYRDAERELLRLLSRLCVATAGLDACLDPHLRRLRDASKEGGEKLVAQAPSLGDALLKAQDGRVRGELFARLMERSGIGGAQFKSALKQWRGMAGAPDRASDEQLDELGALLFAGDQPERPPEDRKGGFLGRLLHRSPEQNPNELLLGIIASIDWPQGIAGRVSEMRDLLQAGASGNAWVDVVSEIGGMAASVFDRAHQDAEAASTFLAQLSRRLEALDSYMSDDLDRRQDSLASGAKLGQMVSEEVGGLSANMNAGGGLPGLHQQVLASLDRIQQHVSTHLQEESARGEQAARQAEDMKQQLGALEKETLSLRRQVEESRQQAMRDALTGLPNRRALEERAAEELQRRRSTGKALGVVVFDVDDFKKINDVYGHQAGDRALALIARVLSEELRENDFIARYGGEEMVALIPEVDAAGAIRQANALRARVEGAGMHSNKKPVRITVSGGVALARQDEDFKALFERADQAMYQAKRQGKNRCILAD